MFAKKSLALSAAVTTMPKAQTEYQFLKSERYGFYYYKIAKCGSSYLQALVKQLDGINQEKTLKAKTWDGKRAIAFVVIRNPIDRFTSLYFDKLAKPTIMSQHFLRRGLLKENSQTLEDHRNNCSQSLGWISGTINSNVIGKMNYHWRPQIYRLHKISKMRVHMLTLDGLYWQLPLILSSNCPEINQHMKDLNPQNVSPKFFPASQLVSNKLRQQISRTYASDFRLYAEVNNYWEKIGENVGCKVHKTPQSARNWLVLDREARKRN